MGNVQSDAHIEQVGLVSVDVPLWVCNGCGNIERRSKALLDEAFGLFNQFLLAFAPYFPSSILAMVASCMFEVPS